MDRNRIFEGQVHAPDFPDGLEWLNTAHPLTLEDLRGKFVLLDFWTFCCINCMHILPQIERLERKYPDELVVIGVHSAKFANERETGQIRQAVTRYGIAHPVVNDSAFEIWSQYGVRAWPTVTLINPEGRIIGMLSGEGVFSPIDGVLGEAIPYFEAKGSLIRGALANRRERLAPTLLSFPGKIAADAYSGRLFVSDSNHHRILILDRNGTVEDTVGSGDPGFRDGSLREAELRDPQGLAFDGHLLYVADTGNHAIRRVNLASRWVETVAGTGEQAREMNVAGSGRSVALNSPWDVLVAGEMLFVAMAGSHQIWLVDPRTGGAEPFAGSTREGLEDGWRLGAALAQPSGLANDGRTLFFADSETSAIRSVGLSTDAAVRTLIGKGLFDFGDIDGAAEKARLQHPLGVAWHDGRLWIADTYNSKIKVLDPEKRVVKTVAGTGRPGFRDGKLSQAAFNEPGGLAWLGSRLYVADTNNHRIRVVDPEAGEAATLELHGLERLPGGQGATHTGWTAAQPRPELDIRLPAGYRLSGEPVTVRREVPGGAVVEVVVYYCSPDGLCLVHRALVPSRHSGPFLIEAPAYPS